MTSISIHPCRERPVANTSKPYKGGGRGKLAKKQAWLGARRRAHSVTVSDKSVKNPAGFKSPGSMK